MLEKYMWSKDHRYIVHFYCTMGGTFADIFETGKEPIKRVRVGNGSNWTTYFKTAIENAKQING